MTDKFAFTSDNKLSSYNDDGSFPETQTLIIANTSQSKYFTINTTSFNISNTTTNFTFNCPTNQQKDDENYFLNANGNWALVTTTSGQGSSGFPVNTPTAQDILDDSYLNATNAWVPKSTFLKQQVDQKLVFKTPAAADAYFVSQSDGNFAFYSTDSSGGARSVCNVQTDNDSSSLNINIPLKINSNLIDSSGQNGYPGLSLMVTGDRNSVRWVPTTSFLLIQNYTSSYVLNSADAGTIISITSGGVTVDGANLKNPGEQFYIYNNSNSDQTITEAIGTTMYVAGKNQTGDATLNQRGLATILCIDVDTFIIHGPGVV